MSDGDKKHVLKEASGYCSAHNISYPAHLGCPRCRSGQ